MLEVKELSFSYNDTLLFSDISCTLKPRYLLQLEGANGSGKTTLLRIISGMVPSRCGQILWNGRQISKCWENYRQSLLFIGHLSGINQSLTARENLYFLVNLHRTVTMEKIDQALAQMQLAGYEHRPCYQLSAGQKQRVALARLLLSTQKFWILDEPFTSLDNQGIKALESCIVNHLNSGGMVLITTHYSMALNYPLHNQLKLS